MSWFPDRPQPSWFRRFCTRVLKTGPVPKHVAIIMDGNRRFAAKNSMEKAEGHLKGFDKLTETLEWCLDLGILEVTVYAFSIENFKRSKEEVECLMELSRKKFARLMEEKDLLDKHGVCIRVLGDLSLLPKDIQETIAEAVTYTRQNKRATLNVCFSYTSRDEICAAMRETIQGVQEGQIRESDISEEVVERCLYTAPSGFPELLIRTSGEVRLSDFLLWQSSYSVLSFMKVLWPDFSIWHLFAAVLHYQMNYQEVQEAKEKLGENRRQIDEESDKKSVLAEMDNVRNSSENNITLEQDRLTTYTQHRKERIEVFLQHVQDKRLQSLESMLSRSSRYQKLTDSPL